LICEIILARPRSILGTFLKELLGNPVGEVPSEKQLHTKVSQAFTEEQSKESFLFWACNIREPVSSHFT